ncbi:acetylesterase [Bifidobacterium dolichotidis]|uniref:Acetylesterase n=1 Tax=Bifidobacterium dolichotidis TaxID=2306976 RepID=A0A430FTD2_9BIFI|nr:alpha/beta hydrolase-fold protein [Bifidobacterium dolichotidis]RSX56142.1 acetylesterase [Bifidobacterium dolichotidis]
MSHITVNFKSKALMRAVTYHVLLPTDEASGVMAEPPFKTLYFLNGFTSSAQELIEYLPFRKQGELKHIAVVMPDGENSFYLDHAERYSNYSSYVTKELIEETRRLLPLSTKREDTFLGGLSMGGYGALINGALHRDLFSKVACMSPVIDMFRMSRELPAIALKDSMLDALFGTEEQFKSSPMYPINAWSEGNPNDLPELYMCVGQQDAMVHDQIKEFYTQVRAIGASVQLDEAPGEHDLGFWDPLMDDVFSFLAGIEPGTKNHMFCDLNNGDPTSGLHMDRVIDSAS